MGTVGLITYPDSGPIGKLKDMFSRFAASIWQAMPVKMVPTLAALNALTMNPSSLPVGSLAVLTADASGLASGAQFVIRQDGKWYLTGTTAALNIDTFVTALSTYTNIKTTTGAMCWNIPNKTMFTFTSAAGVYDSISRLQVLTGSGATKANLLANTTVSFPIAFPTGTFDAVPSQIFVSADSTRPQCTAVNRTKDGFTAQLSNWSPGGMPAGVKFYWIAFA